MGICIICNNPPSGNSKEELNIDNSKLDDLQSVAKKLDNIPCSSPNGAQNSGIDQVIISTSTGKPKPSRCLTYNPGVTKKKITKAKNKTEKSGAEEGKEHDGIRG